jgi:hypothetical protein
VVSDQGRRTMRNGLIALAFIVIVGSVGSVLQKQWDTLPAPPQSHLIQFTKPDPMDLDHWSAVLLQANFDKMKSQEKLPVTNVAMYVSDASPDDVRQFYRNAMDTPWMVNKDEDVKGRRIIIYRKMITGELRIIAIEKRLVRDAPNHVSDGSGSIVATAELNER